MAELQQKNVDEGVMQQAMAAALEHIEPIAHVMKY